MVPQAHNSKERRTMKAKGVNRVALGRFQKYKEYVLNLADTCGVFMELAQIEPK